MKKQKSKVIAILVVAALAALMLFLTACGASMPNVIRNPNANPEAQVLAMRDTGWVNLWFEDFRQRENPREEGLIFEIGAERSSITEEQFEALYDNESNWRDGEFIWNGRVWMEFAGIAYFYSVEYAIDFYNEIREYEEGFFDKEELPSGVRVFWDIVRNGTIVSVWSRVQGNFQNVQEMFPQLS